MVDGQGDLEDQLAEVKKKSAEIADRKEDLRIIEDLGAQMEEALILDNKWVIILDRTRLRSLFLKRCGTESSMSHAFCFRVINTMFFWCALDLLSRYTEHSTVDLAQQWDQLDQLAMRMKHNLEQQIQARNTTGVSEETLKEFTIMFK